MCIGRGVQLRQGEAAQEAQARAFLVPHADREPGQGHDLPAGHPPARRAPEGEDLPQAQARVHVGAEACEERLLRRALGDQGGHRSQGHQARGAASPERTFLRPPELRPALAVQPGRVRLARPVGVRRAHAQAAGSPLQARRAPPTSRSCVRRRGKRVRRIKSSYPRGKSLVQIRLGRKAKRGAYRVTLKAKRPGSVSQLTLRARYL